MDISNEIDNAIIDNSAKTLSKNPKSLLSHISSSKSNSEKLNIFEFSKPVTADIEAELIAQEIELHSHSSIVSIDQVDLSQIFDKIDNSVKNEYEIIHNKFDEKYYLDIINDLKLKNQQLLHNIDEHVTENVSNNQIITSLKNEINKLTIDINTNKNIINQLNKQIETLNEKFNEKEKTINEIKILNKEIDKLHENYKNDITNIYKDNEIKINNYEYKINNYENQLKLLNEQINNLQNELLQKNQSIMKLTNELTLIKNEIITLENTNKYLTKQLNECENADRELSTYKRRCNLLESQLNELMSENKALQNQIIKLNSINNRSYNDIDSVVNTTRSYNDDDRQRNKFDIRNDKIQDKFQENLINKGEIKRINDMYGDNRNNQLPESVIDRQVDLRAADSRKVIDNNQRDRQSENRFERQTENRFERQVNNRIDNSIDRLTDQRQIDRSINSFNDMRSDDMYIYSPNQEKMNSYPERTQSTSNNNPNPKSLANLLGRQSMGSIPATNISQGNINRSQGTPFATETSSRELVSSYNELDKQLTNLMTEKSALLHESEKLHQKGGRSLKERTRLTQVENRLQELNKEIAITRKSLSSKPA